MSTESLEVLWGSLRESSSEEKLDTKEISREGNSVY